LRPKKKEENMPAENAGLSGTFIEQQRKRLGALQNQLSRAAEAGEGDRRNESADGPLDAGDQGAIMTQRETDDALHKATERRLRSIERALEKIAEGTYGLSDANGEPIPKGRLENVPEAIYTVEEERQREAGPPDEPITPSRDREAHVNAKHRKVV
jgi:DnaK suppressor protein